MHLSLYTSVTHTSNDTEKLISALASKMALIHHIKWFIDMNNS